MPCTESESAAEPFSDPAAAAAAAAAAIAVTLA